MEGSISATSPTLPAQKDYHVFYLAKSSNCSESHLCKEVPLLQKLFDTETSPENNATQFQLWAFTHTAGFLALF